MDAEVLATARGVQPDVSANLRQPITVPQNIVVKIALPQHRHTQMSSAVATANFYPPTKTENHQVEMVETVEFHQALWLL